MTSSGPLELAPIDAAQSTDGEILFIGTATVLIRCGGFTILTDPNFLHQGDHAKLGYGLRSRRRTEPARAIAELPPLDFVVLSHHHGDHFDEVAARELDKDVPIITTAHAARKLSRQGFRRPIALDTWETQTVTAGRDAGPHHRRAGQACAAAVAGPVATGHGQHDRLQRGDAHLFRLYITGDTLLYDRLEEIPRRYPDIDLGLIHLGGTRVLGVLVTMDGVQGVQALQI